MKDNELRSLQERVARESRTLVLPLQYEERAEGDAPDGTLYSMRGHAAVFDQLSEDLGGFRERIKRGAFRKALDGNPNVKALWNHDARMVLASTSGKTLDMREDPRGLHYYAQVADTSYARDLQVLLKRNDVNQSSFAFDVGEDNWIVKRGEDGTPDEVIREIVTVTRLYDVSPVTYPAYPQTDVSARGMLLRGGPQLLSRGAGEVDQLMPSSHHLEALLRQLAGEGATITININGSPAEELDRERGRNAGGSGLAEEDKPDHVPSGTKARMLALLTPEP